MPYSIHFCLIVFLNQNLSFKDQQASSIGSPRHNYNNNLNIVSDVCTITYSAKPGGNNLRFRAEQLSFVEFSQPNVVILQLGSNDLCDPLTSPQTFVDSIAIANTKVFTPQRNQRLTNLQKMK